MPEKEGKEVFLVAQKIAKALKKAYDCDGVNILQNNGEASGQSVFHMHVHVIPRFIGDDVVLCDSHKKVDDMEAVQKEIKEAMEQ